MEIVKSKQQAWAFTYKKLGSQPVTCALDYTGVVNMLNDNGFVKHCQGELDSKGRYHIHGIVLLRRGFHRKRLLAQGYHCCLREIYDEKDWIKYCNKSKETDDVPYLFDPIYEINN